MLPDYQSLTTVEECDAALQEIASELEALQVKIVTQDYGLRKAAGLADKIAKEHTELEEAVVKIKSVATQLSEGLVKNRSNASLQKLEIRLHQLETKRKRNNPVILFRMARQMEVLNAKANVYKKQEKEVLKRRKELGGM